MNLLAATCLMIIFAALAEALAAQSAGALHAHLFRLGLWAIASIIAGAMLGWQSKQPAYRQFALQSFVWGTIDFIIVAAAWRDRSLPDAVAAARLREFLWFNEGLDIGYVAVGLALVLTARHWSARALAGAGWGVIVQGAALLVLDTILIWQLPGAAEWAPLVNH